MAFFKKLKERLFRSSSKIEEGLDAIVEDGGEAEVEEVVANPSDDAEVEAQAAGEQNEKQRARLSSSALSTGQLRQRFEPAAIDHTAESTYMAPTTTLNRAREAQQQGVQQMQQRASIGMPASAGQAGPKPAPALPPPPPPPPRSVHGLISIAQRNHSRA